MLTWRLYTNPELEGNYINTISVIEFSDGSTPIHESELYFGSRLGNILYPNNTDYVTLSFDKKILIKERQLEGVYKLIFQLPHEGNLILSECFEYVSSDQYIRWLESHLTPDASI